MIDDDGEGGEESGSGKTKEGREKIRRGDGMERWKKEVQRGRTRKTHRRERRRRERERIEGRRSERGKASK